MAKFATTSLEIAMILALSPLFSPTTALAGAGNLECYGGFKKVKTYANSINCKPAAGNLPSKHNATKTSVMWSVQANCNGHMSAPQRKVWKKNGKWAVHVTFICANIL